MNHLVAAYWYRNYAADYCTLCGNSGVIDTRGVRTPAGLPAGRLNWCICPNGQCLRDGHGNNNYERMQYVIRARPDVVADATRRAFRAIEGATQWTVEDRQRPPHPMALMALTEGPLRPEVVTLHGQQDQLPAGGFRASRPGAFVHKGTPDRGYRCDDDSCSCWLAGTKMR